MKQDKKTTLTNAKYFKKAFAMIDYVFDDLCTYLGKDKEYILIYWIRSHEKDLKKYVKRQCMETFPSLYQENAWFPDAQAYVRYRLGCALTSGGTDEFFCRPPVEKENSGKIHDWYCNRNETHDYRVNKKAEYDKFCKRDPEDEARLVRERVRKEDQILLGILERKEREAKEREMGQDLPHHPDELSKDEVERRIERLRKEEEFIAEIKKNHLSGNTEIMDSVDDYSITPPADDGEAA